MKELEITIAGQTGTGKSTMMILLEQFLIDNGFTVELNLENEIDYGSEHQLREAFNKYVTERELALMKDTKITLKTLQVKRIFEPLNGSTEESQPETPDNN